MSDEEKKAILELNHYCNLTQYWKNVEYTKPEFDNYITTILNLIEKQSKEIEELKEEIEEFKEQIADDFENRDRWE